jgi:serine/threonine-protein kinase HipA
MSTAPGTRVGVHLDLRDGPVRVGTAYVTTRRRVATTSFVYDDDYLARPGAIAISPELPLSAGRIVTVGLPGALSDSTPDRWGRNLIKKQLHAEARAIGRTIPTIGDIDFLLGVSDTTRQGALRFTVGDNEEFLAVGHDVPKLIDLPRLLNAADAVSRDAAAGDDLAAIKALLDAGSGSLGGARPKASVGDGDRLHIAKFPHHSDEWDVMAWEMTALDLAERCGVRTPAHRLVDVSGRHVLLVERFDRDGGARVPYISAMTLLSGTDGEAHDYVEVAEALAEHGSAVTDDLRQLWRRIAFSVALNNTDDHLRNHGCLYRSGGWTLSPVFDVNPNPDPGANRVTSINFVTDPTVVRDALLAAAPYFGVDSDAAQGILDEVDAAIAGWRDVAARNGLSDTELRRFADVLDR